MRALAPEATRAARHGRLAHTLFMPAWMCAEQSQRHRTATTPLSCNDVHKRQRLLATPLQTDTPCCAIDSVWLHATWQMLLLLSETILALSSGYTHIGAAFLTPHIRFTYLKRTTRYAWRTAIVDVLSRRPGLHLMRMRDWCWSQDRDRFRGCGQGLRAC